MEHIAIMKKSWKLIDKILSGEKTLETRWYKNKYPPWNLIKQGETVYFKDSGEPVTVRAKVLKILQFESLNDEQRLEILKKYIKEDTGAEEIPSEIKDYINNKNYCILIFLDNVEKIKPFFIDKEGFGIMSSWICIDNVEKIKVERISQ